MMRMENLVGDARSCAPTQRVQTLVLKDTVRSECPKCSPGKDVSFVVQHQLFRAPAYFSLLLVWGCGAASAEQISSLMQVLPLTLDLALVLDGLDTTTSRPLYRLRTMICFYGAHFVLIAYNPAVNQWVQFDDSSVKPLGSWADVCEKCMQGRFQPLVCFYENYSDVMQLPPSQPSQV